MEELSERALLRNLQKEQERERRRVRDRQRRQSMSVEEREKHLARRRRNYQLRRQRAQNARLHPQFNPNPTNNASSTPQTPTNQHPSIPDINISVQCNGNGGCIPHVPFDERQACVNSQHTHFVGLEVPAHKLAKLPTRLRLSHIKHLARSLDDPVAFGESHRIAADLVVKGNATPDCMPPKGLRLNRVKQLARGLNSDIVETIGGQDQQNETGVEQNLPSRELHPISSTLPKLVQSNNVRGEDQ